MVVVKFNRPIKQKKEPSAKSCLTPCCPHGHHTGKDPRIEGRYYCSLNPKEIHTTHPRVGCHGHD